jgi:hypothetical protein
MGVPEIKDRKWHRITWINETLFRGLETSFMETGAERLVETSLRCTQTLMIRRRPHWSHVEAEGVSTSLLSNPRVVGMGLGCVNVRELRGKEMREQSVHEP